MVLELAELSTFGALLRFAMYLERQAGEFYGSLASKVYHFSTTELFSRYAKEYARRLKLLEDIRQRNINEVLLEPISNMDSKPYSFTSNVDDRMTVEAAFGAALEVETKVGAFYSDSLKAAGLVLGEASRVFRRLSEENSERSRALSSLQGASTT